MADIPLTSTEAACVHKYFSSVDAAFSQQMGSPHPVDERYLASALGALLRGDPPYYSLVPYALRDLNADLTKCGLGTRLIVNVFSPEGKEATEGPFDLRLVLKWDNPLLGVTHESSVWILCQSLAVDSLGRFSLGSSYCDISLDALRPIKSLVQGGQEVCLAQFHPTLEAICHEDRDQIRAFEARLDHSGHAAGWLDRRPGIRFWSWPALVDLNLEGLTLANCYQHAIHLGSLRLSDRPDSTAQFSPLADFAIRRLLSSSLATASSTSSHAPELRALRTIELHLKSQHRKDPHC